MRRPGYFFAYVLLALLVSRTEWSDLHRNSCRIPQNESAPGCQIPLQTVYRGEKARESREFGLRSKAAVVLDTETGEILFEKNGEEKLPVASLTKLMSALAFLEADPDLSDTARITVADAWGSGRDRL